MSLPSAFWDSSALVPLCVRQPQTAQAIVLYKVCGVTVWWATPVEIVSGLTRLERMGELSRDEFLAGKDAAQQLANFWETLSPTASIAIQACALLETYPLRAADALQLAAALENWDDVPDGHLFVTADRRLAAAARQRGFIVELI